MTNGYTYLNINRDEVDKEKQHNKFYDSLTESSQEQMKSWKQQEMYS